MKVQCKYCDSFIDDINTNCPNCGAPLETAARFADKQPRTIEELQKWYAAMKLPPENVTRFFVGKDITEPKAFGIYKGADGDFVVYKNKADGSRAVRYRGSDEAYAVNEIYQRLKEEIVNQKSHNADRKMQRLQNVEKGYETGQKKRRKRSGFRGLIEIACMMVIINGLAGAAIMAGSIASLSNRSTPAPAAGYYSYEGKDYYHQGNDWYYYTEWDDDWGHTTEENIPEAVANDIDGIYRTDGHEGLPFEDTFWYHEPTENTYGNDNGYDSYNNYHDDYDYDWDDDYGWDSNDDWDYDDTDWDSDW